MPGRTIVRSLVFLAVILLAPRSADAQSSSDGSLYSRFGIGELQTFTTPQGDAMGQSGFALHSLNYLNLGNPATWADQVLVRASAGVTYQNIRISDASNAESRLASGYLNGIQFGVPLLQRKLGVGLGFVPYSRVSYSVVNEGTIQPDNPDPDTVGYRITFSGSGGLQQVVGGLGYRINGNLGVGASLNGIFGIIDTGRRTSFIESGSASDYDPTNIATSTRMHGFTATIGTYFNLNGLLRNQDFLGVSLAFTLPTTLHAERVNTLGEQLDRDTLGTTLRGDVDVPWRLGFGASYQPDARWTLSAGGQYAPWTDFKSTLTFPGYEPSDGSGLSDRLQIGAGVEFLPAGSDLLDSYFRRIGYRLGASYETSYIAPTENADLRTLLGTIGLSVPTMLSGTRLDLTLQVGTRGESQGVLVHDVFYRLSASVNIGERWFQTQRLR